MVVGATAGLAEGSGIVAVWIMETGELFTFGDGILSVILIMGCWARRENELLPRLVEATLARVPARQANPQARHGHWLPAFALFPASTVALFMRIAAVQCNHPSLHREDGTVAEILALKGSHDPCLEALARKQPDREGLSVPKG